jgi:hypothetical protein
MVINADLEWWFISFQGTSVWFNGISWWCHVMLWWFLYIYIVNSSATKIWRFIVIQSQLVYTCIYIHSHMISYENWVRLENGLNTPPKCSLKRNMINNQWILGYLLFSHTNVLQVARFPDFSIVFQLFALRYVKWCRLMQCSFLLGKML